MLLNKSLLRLGFAGRWYFILAAVTGIAGGTLSIWQGRIFSKLINQAFLLHFSVNQSTPLLSLLLIVMLLRACLLGGQEIFSTMGNHRLKIDVRKKLVETFSQFGITRLNSEAAGELSQTYMEGVEALEAYFGQYLPQVLLAFFVPPIILIVVFFIDPWSGLVFLITGPLIPFFMRLIGEMANSQTKQQWEKLSNLSAFLLEAIQALPMLKRLGITEEFVNKLAEKGDSYRQTTLEVLRLSFLSAFTLELLTTLSTAIVAVQVGLRLLYGWIPFEQALFVLVIAPEFYLPLRLLGQRFHAGMAGVASGKRINEIITPNTKDIIAHNPIEKKVGISEEIQESIKQGIVFENVEFYQKNRGLILENIRCIFEANKISVITGESGAGKTTLIYLLLGLLEPSAGNILIGKQSITGINLEQWWDCIGWVAQDPYFFHGSIFENITLGDSRLSEKDVIRAAQMANAHAFISALPEGYQTMIGEGGVGLSAGQAQRLALARAYVRNAPLLIIDEGSANIDPESLEQILASLSANRKERTIILVSHQPQVIAIADKVFEIEKTRLIEKQPGLALVNGKSDYRDNL
ncbi:MAG: thiol reductant ABC exporter subunit CydD, partial [Anaerolineales bacterium]